MQIYTNLNVYSPKKGLSGVSFIDTLRGYSYIYSNIEN